MTTRLVSVALQATRGPLDVPAEGQGMTEYAMLLSGVALMAIVALFNVGPRIAVLLNKVSASLS
jgi:hypothetical protein